MSAHSATVVWERPTGATFKDNKYSRAHEWRFDGGSSRAGLELPGRCASAAFEAGCGRSGRGLRCLPLVVSHAVLPVLCRQGGLIVDRYEDEAVGETGKNASGAVAVLKVRLRPRISWADNAPAADQLADLHHRAHESCYIANSVTAEIAIEPR